MSGDPGFPGEAWEEIIDGKVVPLYPRPSVNHNFVVGNIGSLFEGYIHGRHPHMTLIGNFALYLTERDQFTPDVIVVCDREKIKHTGVYGAPDLVVEVLSPSTAKRDRGYKKDAYAKCGVREYWLVGSLNKSAEVYHLEDGSFNLHDIYLIYPDCLLEKMTEEEREAIPTKFKCSLYDDFEIALEDIFNGMLPE